MGRWKTGVGGGADCAGTGVEFSMDSTREIGQLLVFTGAGVGVGAETGAGSTAGAAEAGVMDGQRTWVIKGAGCCAIGFMPGCMMAGIGIVAAVERCGLAAGGAGSTEAGRDCTCSRPDFG